MKKRFKAGSKIVTDVLTLENLLFKNTLSIPEYQRPYKWSDRNVTQLIDDILLRKNDTPYRIGTIILHNSKSKLNIVDGQQRIFTLSLIAGELLRTRAAKKLLGLSPANLCMADEVISDPITLGNLHRNHLLIKSRIKEFQKEDLLFFFKKCEFVYIELDNISEAFQFFDSQNSRGKDLAPHDLLKAFHLREMVVDTPEEQLKCVEQWEVIAESLQSIFENYLYRLRMWSKGHSAFSFTKDNIGNFKGISATSKTFYNFQQLYRISHSYIEKYNIENDTAVNVTPMEFPFQIDQVIINGKRFFEYINYYSKIILAMEDAYVKDKKMRIDSVLSHIDQDSTAAKIMETLRTYNGRRRKGDLFIRNMFDCCIIYYIDKFGPYRLEDAIAKFFLWSFTLRLEYYAVNATTTQNLARSTNGFICLTREAVDPKDILTQTVRPANYIGKKDAVKDIESLVKLFKELNSIQTNER